MTLIDNNKIGRSKHIIDLNFKLIVNSYNIYDKKFCMPSETTGRILTNLVQNLTILKIE